MQQLFKKIVFLEHSHGSLDDSKHCQVFLLETTIPITRKEVEPIGMMAALLIFCKKDCKRFLFLIMITVVGRGYEKNLNMKNVD